MTGTVTVLARASKTPDPNRDIRVERSDSYPKQIWWFLACFITLLTLCHVGSLFVSRRRRQRMSRTIKEGGCAKVGESAKSNANNKPSLRRVPHAILNSFRIIAYRITLPIGGGNVLNGAEIGVIAGYIVALFTWEFINCMNVKTKVKFDPAYWANRAGNIAASQLALVIVLGGKNNLLSVLTGISYEKLNVLHRAASRILLVFIWVHFWGRIEQGLVGSTALKNPWVRTGVLTATAYTLLVLISFRPFRTKYYELFFFSHITLALIVMIGAYYHIRKAQGFYLYLVPSYVFWSLDRALRGLRVFWNNRSTRSSSQASAPLEATAEILSPTMVRLSLARNMTWRAGQSAFITMPGVSQVPLEAHPFTIATIPQSRSFRSIRSVGSSDEKVSKESVAGVNDLVFLIRVKEGFTRRLRTFVEQGAQSLSVYVDGPYGSPPEVNSFETVILVAGGSGASYVLPLFQDIVYNARHGKSACRSILLIWAVAHREHMSWISRPLYEALEAAPETLNIRIRLYVTQDKYTEEIASGYSSDDKSPVDSEADTLLQDVRVKLEHRRPDAIALLQEELASAEGAVSVDVAGPADLAKDVRMALSYGAAGPKSVLKGGSDITLHVETYGIA